MKDDKCKSTFLGTLSDESDLIAVLDRIASIISNESTYFRTREPEETRRFSPRRSSRRRSEQFRPERRRGVGPTTTQTNLSKSLSDIPPTRRMRNDADRRARSNEMRPRGRK